MGRLINVISLPKMDVLLEWVWLMCRSSAGVMSTMQMLVKTHIACRQEGGVQEAQRLHTRMGELIWSCRGWHGLGAAAEHYSRGDDLTAYAAGGELW